MFLGFLNDDRFSVCVLLAFLTVIRRRTLGGLTAGRDFLLVSLHLFWRREKVVKNFRYIIITSIPPGGPESQPRSLVQTIGVKTAAAIAD